MSGTPELLAPAGDWDCARAAVANGADAIYFGLPELNARLRAGNFDHADLPALVEFLHHHGVKAYVALNVLIFPAELEVACGELVRLSEAGVDAVIVQDVGLAALAARIVPHLPIHASTQMTITSPEGVEFARELGVRLVVLARELSLRELERFDRSFPMEVFVHGALCVAYSGQCLTSESLGQRSANRGECAQACRMPYEMIVDGEKVDLGERRYLLSPKDLAAVADIPRLVDLGIASFKIEGRLKSPEYVAAVTRLYREAIDAAVSNSAFHPSAEDQYALDMTFSRGFFNGWFDGPNHQELVGATFGKKRGVLLGRVRSRRGDSVKLDRAPGSPRLKPGDGIVFEDLSDTNAETGGRVYSVAGEEVHLARGSLSRTTIHPGCRVWKTDDPALRSRLRKSFSGRLPSRPSKIDLPLHITGAPGRALCIRSGETTVQSTTPAQKALHHALDESLVREIFGRLHETPFQLGKVTLSLSEPVFLPKSALTAMRRMLIDALEPVPERSAAVPFPQALDTMLDSLPLRDAGAGSLSVLVRTTDQMQAALELGIPEVILDFEDIRRYREAVAMAGNQSRVILATPRIQKAGESGFFRLIENARPAGVLIRNVGGITYFRERGIPMIGDFSLNVANPASAAVFFRLGMERLTFSYDLTASQILDFQKWMSLRAFDLVLHQHMPMFHMEHCAFAAFLSDGKTFLDCGRPCEKHTVELRDRVGTCHPLSADVGCRNTLFNARAQSGARHLESFRKAGIRNFRIELLRESAEESTRIIQTYGELLRGEISALQIGEKIPATDRLGVTTGTMS